jgi:hypothetical protein
LADDGSYVEIAKLLDELVEGRFQRRAIERERVGNQIRAAR